MINCERIGINPKWPNHKSVMNRVEKRHSPDDFEFMFGIIREYVTREDSSPNQQIPNSHNATNSKAVDLGRYKTDIVLAQASLNTNWLAELSHWARCYEVGIKMRFFWHYQFSQFPNRVRDLRMYGVEYAAQMMGVMALLGWREEATYQGYLTHAALNRSYQLELQYEDEHRRAQAFMLRLFADWVGDISHQWPGYAYDEPIYETLLQYWRTPDPEALVPCLLAACDRHTHQVRPDTSKNYYDFQNVGLTRTPIEILFLFRLREWEGLRNPTLDHPLMAAPFDKLPPEQPVPPLDDLMQAVLKRAREDWPNYDQVLSLEALKAG